MMTRPTGKALLADPSPTKPIAFTQAEREQRLFLRAITAGTPNTDLGLIDTRTQRKEPRPGSTVLALPRSTLALECA